MIEPSSRRERKRDRTRAQIFAAAMELFRSHGFVAVTIEQVCAAADVAKGTFFLHFSSKAALLGEWNRALAAELASRLAEPRGSSLSEYRTLVEHLGAQWRERPDAARALLRELLAEPAPAIGETGERDLRAIVEAVVRRGQERGELRRTISPRLAAAAFLASCAAVFSSEAARDAAPEQLRNELLHALLHGVHEPKPRLRWTPG
jgi:AcrR family transcriptional regulator